MPRRGPVLSPTSSANGRSAKPLSIALRIDDHAISEKWWWKGRVSITWSEVSSVEENGGGEYQVYGEEGRSIRFSRYLVDSQRFREEIRRRAKPKVRLAIDPISVTKG